MNTMKDYVNKLHLHLVFLQIDGKSTKSVWIERYHLGALVWPWNPMHFALPLKLCLVSVIIGWWFCWLHCCFFLFFFFWGGGFSLSFSIMCIHHHHVMLLAQISLTLLLPVLIVYRYQQIFKAISCIGTELL